jgi:phenylpropionate dioxygenase-like ring-hydroxylating dioxygenase large terminal subunit
MSFDDALIRGFWHLACHRHELPNDRDFLRFETGAGDIVLFNDQGRIVAFDNRCPHRGARWYNDAHGNQRTMCSYHQWSYRNGRVFAANPGQFACDISRIHLNEYRTAWCGDFLFVGIEPSMSLDEQLGGFSGALEAASRNIAGRVDFNRYDYECYWPLAIENALEPYHISAIHRETLAKLELGEGQNVFDGVNSVWRSPVGNSRVARQLAALRKFFAIDIQYEGYESFYLFPFSMLSSTFGYSYSLQNFFPARVNAGDRTHFTSRLLSVPARDPESSRVLQSFLESTAAVNRQVFEEDHSAVKLCPRDSWSMESLPYASKLEEKIVHFRESCRGAAATVAS